MYLPSPFGVRGGYKRSASFASYFGFKISLTCFASVFIHESETVLHFSVISHTGEAVPCFECFSCEGRRSILLRILTRDLGPGRLEMIAPFLE